MQNSHTHSSLLYETLLNLFISTLFSLLYILLKIIEFICNLFSSFAIPIVSFWEEADRTCIHARVQLSIPMHLEWAEFVAGSAISGVNTRVLTTVQLINPLTARHIATQIAELCKLRVGARQYRLAECASIYLTRRRTRMSRVNSERGDIITYRPAKCTLEPSRCKRDTHAWYAQ